MAAMTLTNMSQGAGGLITQNGSFVGLYNYNGAGVPLPAGSVLVSPSGTFNAISAAAFNALPV